MTHTPVTRFYRNLGAVLFLADVVLTGVVFALHIPVDKFVVVALALPAIGGLALMRPEILNRAVKYGASKLPTRE